MNNKRKNKNKSGNALLLLGGALAGAAATYYLTTPKGKQFIKKISEGSSELQEAIVDKASTIAQDVRNKSQSAMDVANEKITHFKESAINQIDSVKKTLASSTSEIEDVINDELGDLEKGINKAKRKMEYTQSSN